MLARHGLWTCWLCLRDASICHVQERTQQLAGTDLVHTPNLSLSVSRSEKLGDPEGNQVTACQIVIYLSGLKQKRP